MLQTAHTTYHLERYIKTFNTGKNISVHTQHTFKMFIPMGELGLLDQLEFDEVDNIMTTVFGAGEIWGRPE